MDADVPPRRNRRSRQPARSAGLRVLDLSRILSGLSRRWCSPTSAPMSSSSRTRPRVTTPGNGCRPTRATSSAYFLAVNRHQRGDKGFGPALGPDAGQRAVKSFERVGYQVQSGSSDWEFGRDHQEIQHQIVMGWAHAADELGDLPSTAVAAWLERRSAIIFAGRSRMRIGHLDFFAMPTAMR